jgi:hypothetical protein
MVVCWGVVVRWFPVHELPFSYVGYPGLTAMSTVACEMTRLSTVKAGIQYEHGDSVGMGQRVSATYEVMGARM